MKRKQFVIFLIVAFAGGIIGGMLSGYFFSSSTAFATDEKGRKVLEANEFRVVGENGKVLSTYGSRKFVDYAGILLSPTKETKTYEIAMIAFFNKDGHSRCKISPDEIEFNSGDSSSINQFGTSGLKILNNKREKIIFLGQPFPHIPAQLLMSDNNGINRINVEVSYEGNPHIDLYDENKKLRAALGHTSLMHTNSGSTELRAESSLVLFNDEGKVLWAAP